MRFKKVLCCLMSAAVFFEILIGTAGAISMEEIFKNTSFPPVLELHIPKLYEYIEEERIRIESLLETKEQARQIKRMDSIVFGLFCCFCYSRGLNRFIEEVAEKRNSAELKEDRKVIRSIFPENFEDSFDGSEGLKQLCIRLSIDAKDIMLSRESFKSLADLIDDVVPAARSVREETSGYDSDEEDYE